MEMRKKISPCARCEEVFEQEWPEALAFYCGGEIPAGERVLIETQRLRHPRGTRFEITEGPLPGCPKGYYVEGKGKSEEGIGEVSPTATGYEKAKAMLEAALQRKERTT